MYESICEYCLVGKSYLILLQPHGLVACQAPLSMGFPRQESRSGLLFPSPGDLPNPVIKPTSPVLASRLYHRAPWEAHESIYVTFFPHLYQPSVVSNSLQFAHLTPLLVKTHMSRVSHISKITPRFDDLLRGLTELTIYLHLLSMIVRRRQWYPTPVLFPGKSHGQRSLMGYRPRSHKRVRPDLATKQQLLI